MATSYDNPGGSGDRTSIITVACVYTGGPFMNTDTPTVFINGVMTNANWFNSVPVAGNAIRFDFGTSKVIDEATFYQSETTQHGVWRWQGSANGSDWTNVGDTFTLGGSTAQVQTSLNGNTAGYRYWQILGVSGNASNAPYMREWTFKIGDPVVVGPRLAMFLR